MSLWAWTIIVSICLLVLQHNAQSPSPLLFAFTPNRNHIDFFHVTACTNIANVTVLSPGGRYIAIESHITPNPSDDACLDDALTSQVITPLLTSSSSCFSNGNWTIGSGDSDCPLSIQEDMNAQWVLETETAYPKHHSEWTFPPRFEDLWLSILTNASDPVPILNCIDERRVVKRMYPISHYGTKTITLSLIPGPCNTTIMNSIITDAIRRYNDLYKDKDMQIRGYGVNYKRYKEVEDFNNCYFPSFSPLSPSYSPIPPFSSISSPQSSSPTQISCQSDTDECILPCGDGEKCTRDGICGSGVIKSKSKHTSNGTCFCCFYPYFLLGNDFICTSTTFCWGRNG